MKKKIMLAVALCLTLLLGLAAGFGVSSFFNRDSGGAQLQLSAQALDSVPLSFNLGTNTGAELSPAEIYKLACAQTVGVKTEVNTMNAFGQLSSANVTGTGFVVTKDGYILTNYHVVESAYNNGLDVKVIFYDNTSYTASIVGCDEDNDIAVLKIDAKDLSCVTIGNSDTMNVGESVYAVGNPLGELTYTMTGGIISALDREITVEPGKTVHMFQVDAAINSGNSGGPIYNSRGEVLGIVTAKYASTGVEGLGFALPINTAVSDANEIMKHGYVTGKADLGVEVLTTGGYTGMSSGAYILSVDVNSCAAEAGIMPYDIITAIDDHTINGYASYRATLSEYSAGDDVTVVVVRRGETMSFELTLDEKIPQPDYLRQQTQQSDNTQQWGGFGNYWGQGGEDIRSWFDNFFSYWN